MGDASGSKRRGGREVEERSSKTRRATPGSASLPSTLMRQTHAQEVVQHTSGPWTYIKDGADPQKVVELLKEDGFEDRRDVVKMPVPLRRDVVRAYVSHAHQYAKVHAHLSH